MPRRHGRRPPLPLDQPRLDELALAYVGRFATTRAKLASYLARKLRERGWEGERSPDVEAIVERLSSLGYVDDRSYANIKARSLTARGYGARRVGDALRSAGIGEEDSAEAREQAESEAVESALRYARKRRIGPFASDSPDRAQVERSLAAMVRAGHDFGLSRAILEMEPGGEIDNDSLAQRR